MFEYYQLVILACLMLTIVIVSGVAIVRRNIRLTEERLMKEWEDAERKAKAQREFARAQLNLRTFTKPSVSTTARKTTQHRAVDSQIYVDNSSDDLLTAMILQNAMNSPSGIHTGTVQWDNDIPRITEVPVESYKASEPESSPTPSYSSSYSSSSSDSNYSSSSSDSSYSSSYSDSSSSSDSGSSSSD